jgi:hypothetical protein
MTTWILDDEFVSLNSMQIVEIHLNKKVQPGGYKLKFWFKSYICHFLGEGKC